MIARLPALMRFCGTLSCRASWLALIPRLAKIHPALAEIVAVSVVNRPILPAAASTVSVTPGRIGRDGRAGEYAGGDRRGPWTITEINAARGRLMTSCSSLKTDLDNAGADWVDQEVVVDRNLVTGRSPSDIPTFNREMIKVFSAARQRQHAA